MLTTPQCDGRVAAAAERNATFNAMRSDIEDAVHLLQRGDDAAVERALALLQDTVFSFSMRVCGQREDAEDTMQEVLLKSVPHLPRFDSPKALVVWLYKVAKNRCLMSRRRSKFAPKQDLSLEELMPDREELDQLSTDKEINPEALAIRSEEAAQLRDAIQRLPPQYRIVLVLRDMEGLTDEEVAEITGLRSGTVRVRLHRARLFVRKELVKMKTWKARSGRMVEAVPSRTAATDPPRAARCKAMFAELSSYLDEQLDDSLCEELEQHLNGCEPCKAFLSSLASTIAQCRRLPAECPTGKEAVRLRGQLLKNYEQVRAVVRPGQ
ncbi:MAG: sigma-70 family RNA polymerase sigma factor [Acidobacteriia bacterium]|nr:sigma-70 family RNA polymerase sigma factor [Terriglobia bacterium]